MIMDRPLGKKVVQEVVQGGVRDLTKMVQISAKIVQI